MSASYAPLPSPVVTAFTPSTLYAVSDAGSLYWMPIWIGRAAARRAVVAGPVAVVRGTAPFVASSALNASVGPSAAVVSVVKPSVPSSGVRSAPAPATSEPAVVENELLATSNALLALSANSPP